jgi:hypothetical protein
MQRFQTFASIGLEADARSAHEAKAQKAKAQKAKAQRVKREPRH